MLVRVFIPDDPVAVLDRRSVVGLAVPAVRMSAININSTQ